MKKLGTLPDADSFTILLLVYRSSLRQKILPESETDFEIDIS